MTDPPPHGTLRIVTPKLKAALIAGVVAALGAGLQTCVVALTDVDARADVDVDAPANVLIQVSDIPADAGGFE